MGERDVTVMGEGSVSGGEYGKVKVMGSARFMDLVRAELISVYGSAELDDVDVQELKVAGSARFKGKLFGKVVKISGSVRVNGEIKSESITVNGQLRSDKGVETERFVSRGQFVLDSINANDVSMLLAGRCRVKEIGAENVDVANRGWWGLFHNLFSYPKYRDLEVETIEADRIYLENTSAKCVRGKDVRIGPGCRIGLLEYKDSHSVDSKARVEKVVQL